MISDMIGKGYKDQEKYEENTKKTHSGARKETSRVCHVFVSCLCRACVVLVCCMVDDTGLLVKARSQELLKLSFIF